MGRHHGKFDRPTGGGGGGATLIPIEAEFYTKRTARIILVSAGGYIRGNSEESALWNHIKNQWQAFVTDAAAALAMVDRDYRGWFDQDPVLDDRDTLGVWLEESLATRNTVVVRISPVAAQFNGRIAIAHYHYTWIYNDSDSKQHKEIGRYTDTLVKTDSNAMLLLSDHGGPTA